jgi:hypothetical protein
MCVKNLIKETMQNLEAEELSASEHAYAEYLYSSTRERSEPMDSGQDSQEAFDADLAQAFECPSHVHAEALDTLRQINFGPKLMVEEGSVVRFEGRWFVVAIATKEFECSGVSYMGISLDARIFKVMEGRSAGERITFKGRCLTIQAVL